MPLHLEPARAARGRPRRRRPGARRPRPRRPRGPARPWSRPRPGRAGARWRTRRPTPGSRGARWSPGARSSRRCRSSRRGGRRSGRSRWSTNDVQERLAIDRAGRRRPRGGWSSPAAMSGGKSSRAQSALIPMPTTTRGSSVPRPSLSPSTPASLRSSSGAARRARAASGVRSPARSALGPPVSTTRSLGHFMRTAPTGRPAVVLGRVAHRQRRRAREAPGAVRRQPGRPEAEREQQRGARGRGPGPAVAAPALGLLVRDGQADLRRGVQQPGADDVVRAADGREPLEAAELARRRDGVGHRAVQPAPVPAASTVSGCSSSKAAWSDRTASSTRSSEMMVVIRISDVEIISMLIPASASVPNMRAA